MTGWSVGPSAMIANVSTTHLTVEGSEVLRQTADVAAQEGF